MLIPFRTLAQRHGLKPYGVVHIGANKGQEALAYREIGIRRVIWIEAIPEIFEVLQQETIRYGNGHRCLCACVSDVDGDIVDFHIANNEGQSSSMLKFGTHTEAHPSVKFVGKQKMETVRIDTLFERHHIDLQSIGWMVNIDVQGAELKVLKGMGDLLDYFTDAYIEVNEQELYVGCPLVGEIDTFMTERGFKGAETKMTGFGWGDKYYKRC